MIPREPYNNAMMGLHGSAAVRERESAQAHGWATEAERHAAGIGYPVVLRMAQAAITSMHAVGMSPFVDVLKRAARDAARSLLMSVQQLPPGDPGRVAAERIVNLAAQVASLRDDGGQATIEEINAQRRRRGQTEFGAHRQESGITREGGSLFAGSVRQTGALRERSMRTMDIPSVRPILQVPRIAPGLLPRAPFKSPLL